MWQGCISYPSQIRCCLLSYHSLSFDPPFIQLSVRGFWQYMLLAGQRDLYDHSLSP